MRVSQNTVKKTVTGKLLSISEYLKLKGLTPAGTKPVLTLVPRSNPNPAFMAELERRNKTMLNSKLAMVSSSLLDATATTACFGERLKTAPTDGQKKVRSYRNRTRKVISKGHKVNVVRTYTDFFTKEVVSYSTTETVGYQDRTMHHDSHGCHGRKPRYKDVPRGENPVHSGHFRAKRTMNLNGDLV